MNRIGIIGAMDEEVDILVELMDIKETIEKVIYEKPVGHNFQEHKKGNEESHIMAQIGG